MIDHIHSAFAVYLASLSLLAAVCSAFVAGGVVKGALGVGLPLVIVPVLSLFMSSPQAISLVAIPVLASNLWQAIDSGISVGSLRRFLPLMAALLVATALTVPLTLAMPPAVLSIMVAGAVILAVVLMARRPQFVISSRREKSWSILVGGMSGLMGGVSSLTGPIIIAYLTALRLSRNEFVGCISVIYLCGAIPLYASLAAHGRLGAAELLVSLAGLVPLACGLLLGKWLRRFLDETLFRRAILIFLSVTAAALVLKVVGAG